MYTFFFLLFYITFQGLEITLLKLGYFIYPVFPRQQQSWFFKDKKNCWIKMRNSLIFVVVLAYFNRFVLFISHLEALLEVCWGPLVENRCSNTHFSSSQFFDRLRLFWMPAKHQPDFIYLRHVPLRKVHLFTIVQLSCLVLLWVIKTSRAAIVFPMMVYISHTKPYYIIANIYHSMQVYATNIIHRTVDFWQPSLCTLPVKSFGIST